MLILYILNDSSSLLLGLKSSLSNNIIRADALNLSLSQQLLLLSLQSGRRNNVLDQLQSIAGFYIDQLLQAY